MARPRHSSSGLIVSVARLHCLLQGPYRKLSKHFKGATASSTNEKSKHGTPRSALRVLGLKANESMCKDHGSRASPNSTMDSHGDCVVDSHDISHLPVAMATLAGYA